MEFLLASRSHCTRSIRAIGFVAQTNAVAVASAASDEIAAGSAARGRPWAHPQAPKAPQARARNPVRSRKLPGRVPSATAAPAPTRSTPSRLAFAGLRITMLSTSPAVTRLRPAATGTSLKSRCDIPSHRGVASVSDQANAAARTDRNTSPTAIARAVTDRTDRAKVIAPWYR